MMRRRQDSSNQHTSKLKQPLVTWRAVPSEKNCIGHHGHDFPVTGKITYRKNYFPVTGSNFLFSVII